jgi:hypothetical protein
MPINLQLFRFEVLVERLPVDLVGSVFFATELGGVEQVDQLLLEVSSFGPLPLVPLFQVDNGAGTDLAFEQLTVLWCDR